MRTLVLGASGFVGPHFVHELLSYGHEVFAGAIEPGFSQPELTEDHVFQFDIENSSGLGLLLQSIKPEWVVNLVAQSSVQRSWFDPIKTSRINIEGPLVLLEAIRENKLRPRILLIGSSEEYGVSRQGAESVAEDRTLFPISPYGATKLAQEVFAQVWSIAYDMDIVLTRSFPHIGPGQGLGFVVPDICNQIARIQQYERKPVISVGNMDTSRDITDVRDIVRGYRLLLQMGKSGHVYNIGSGRCTSVRRIVSELVELSKMEIEVQVDSSKFRPTDVPAIAANIEKIRMDTGWEPTIELVTTLADTLQFWRQH